MKRMIAVAMVVTLLAGAVVALAPSSADAAGRYYYRGGHGHSHGGYKAGYFAGGLAVGAVTGLILGGLFAPPVYAAPAPVVYQPAPVYVQPAPVCTDYWVGQQWTGYGWAPGYWARSCR